MRRIVPIAVLGAIGLAILVFVLLSGDPRDRPRPAPEPPAPGSTGPAIETGAAVVARVEPETPEAIARARAAEGSAGAADLGPEPGDSLFEAALSGLVGRVVEPDGTPVPGVVVEVLGGFAEALETDLMRSLFDPDSFAPRIEQARTTTGEDGRFQFRRLDPRGWYLLALNLGRERPQIRFLDRAPNPGETEDLGDLVLAPPTTWSGRVVDERGAPLARARVKASAIPTAGWQGGLAHLRPGGALRLPGILHASHTVEIWEMPRWIERLLDRLPAVASTTDAGGRFLIAGVPEGQGTLVVEAAGRPAHVHGPIPFPKGGGEKDLGDVVVPPGEVAEVRVLDDSGAPVPGAEVRLGILSPFEEELAVFLPSRRTDERGVAVERGVPGTHAYVAVRGSRLADWIVTERRELVGDVIEVRIAATASLRIRTTTKDDTPIDARVAIHRSRDLLSLFPPLVSPRRAPLDRLETGLLVVRGLPRASYRVIVQAEGRRTETVDVDLEDQAEKEITLALGAARFADVRVSAGETPVAGALVVAFGEDEIDDHGLERLASARTNGDGDARVEIPEAGSFHLVASHPGFATRILVLAEPPGVRVPVELGAGGVLEGRISWNGGPPQEPWLLTVEGRSDVQYEPLRVRVTASDGTFRITHLPAGSYQLRALQRLFGGDLLATMPETMDREPRSLSSQRLEVREGETTWVELDTGTGTRVPSSDDATLSGTVFLDGAPLASATVRARGARSASSRTDASGRFEFGVLPPGLYEVQALSSDDGGMLATRRAELLRGSREFLHFDLRSGGPLDVVVSSSGGPVAKARLELLRRGDPWGGSASGGWTVRRATDAAGRHRFDRLGEGRYRLLVRAPGHVDSPPVDLTITAGSAPAPVVVDLVPGAHLSGTVALPSDATPVRVSLAFLPRGENAEWTTARVTLPEGRFEIRELPAGAYTVTLSLTIRRADGSIERPRFEPIVVELPEGGRTDARLHFPSADASGR